MICWTLKRKQKEGQSHVYKDLTNEGLNAVHTSQKKITSSLALIFSRWQGTIGSTSTRAADKLVVQASRSNPIDKSSALATGHYRWKKQTFCTIPLIENMWSLPGCLGPTTSLHISWRYVIHFKDGTPWAEMDIESYGGWLQARLMVPIQV